MATNVDLLTHSHTVLKAKRRAKKNQIESVVFDDQARFEFLTGFRKRNTQKKEAAKAKAIARDREERLQLRKEQRRVLKTRAEENARQVESVFRGDAETDESDGDFETGSSSDRKGKGRDTQAYEDEEQLATVTVIEDCEPESFRHIHLKKRDSNPDLNDNGSKSLQKIDGQPQAVVRKKDHKATKPKKIRYETNAARKTSRMKERSRKHEKAELAGGKGRGRGGIGIKRGKR